ncbi:flagellar biosynthesis protein FlgJ [Enterovirga sp. DB1703]|uniref:Flagellar biosynthesis protein FlgJ n=2 Tax=Enterovirga aerilata TaxID=2730920 RepID=A0A849I5G6_9HYPH|nr:flagellar biosynthesis protein FlgJ [Enterovirga sp. DB1703]
MLGLSLAANLVNGVVGAAAKSATGAEQTRRTAEDFETMFLEQSLDRLTEGAGEEGPLGENGTGGGVYRSMLSKEYARSIVKTGGLGIADQVYRQMLQMQEGAGQ